MRPTVAEPVKPREEGGGRDGGVDRPKRSNCKEDGELGSHAPLFRNRKRGRGEASTSSRVRVRGKSAQNLLPIGEGRNQRGKPTIKKEKPRTVHRSSERDAERKKDYRRRAGRDKGRHYKRIKKSFRKIVHTRQEGTYFLTLISPDSMVEK